MVYSDLRRNTLLLLDDKELVRVQNQPTGLFRERNIVAAHPEIDSKLLEYSGGTLRVNGLEFMICSMIVKLDRLSEPTHNFWLMRALSGKSIPSNYKVWQ